MKMKMKMIVIGFVTCALTIPMMTNAAIKSDGKSTDSLIVTYHAEDLTSLKGIATVRKQIERAAKKICGETSPAVVGSLYRAVKNQNCVDETVRNASIALDNNVATSH